MAVSHLICYRFIKYGQLSKSNENPDFALPMKELRVLN